VDFGVQVKGRILDSAFTMSWEPTYDKLIEAVKAATNAGIRVGIPCLSVLFSEFLMLDCFTGSRDRCSIGRSGSSNTRNNGIL